MLQFVQHGDAVRTRPRKTSAFYRTETSGGDGFRWPCYSQATGKRWQTFDPLPTPPVFARVSDALRPMCPELLHTAHVSNPYWRLAVPTAAHGRVSISFLAIFLTHPRRTADFGVRTAVSTESTCISSYILTVYDFVLTCTLCRWPNVMAETCRSNLYIWTSVTSWK